MVYKKSSVKKMALRSLLTLAEMLSPAAVLGLRLWIAQVFWSSGLTKVSDWQSTLFLFEEEYKVPILPTSVAAFMGTAAELVLPILLILGLGSRIAAAGLLVMTGVIEFTYQHHDQHILWALVLSVILLQGAGRFSIDHFIMQRWGRDIQPHITNHAFLNSMAVFVVIGLAIYTALKIGSSLF